MKKILLSLGLIGIFGGFVAFASASNNSDCKNVEFSSSNVTACVNINKVSSHTRELQTDVDNGSTTNLKCTIMTPDSELKSVSACNGDFSYDYNNLGKTKLWITYNNGSNDIAPSDWDGKPSDNTQRTYPQWMYDFDNEQRGEDNLTDTSSNGDLDNFYLNTDDTSPSTNQYVDLNIKARDSDNSTITDFSDTVKFKVYYRANNSSSWTQTTSSTYYTMSSSYTDGYDFSSSDDGYANLSNFIKFKKNNYDYKVRVYAENDTSIYKEITFTVGTTNNNTSNGDLDNFYLTTDDSSPSTSQYVDLNIKARDSDNSTITDFSDTVKFKVYYRANNSSSWTQTTSSTYYTMGSSYTTNGYDFTSSDDGYANLSNFIKFKKNNYDYKVRVYAENDTSIYKEITFTVGTTNNNTSNGELDNFYLTTSTTTPSTSEYVDLTINARDSDDYTITDYTDTVKFKVYYRANGGSSWTQTTSSTYYTMDSSYTDGYDFSSSDDGIAELSNFIKFKKNDYDYKVRVYAENDTSIYKEITFNVGSDNNTSNGELDNFYLTTDDTTPSILQRVDLTIKARDSDNYTITDYTDAVNFKVYYRANNSSSWTQTTSSSYYTIDSSYTDGYDFTSSNDGIAGLNNFIEFNKKNYDYKVRVYAENDTSIYKEITFTVGTTNNNTSNGDLDNFYLTSSDTTPSTSEYVDLNIKARDSDDYTITDYTDTVNFKVYYKPSSSSSWTQTTSSTYYTMGSSYTNGYDFTSSDDGYANLSNFIKFKKNNYDYKVRVYAENDTSIYKEITFNVGTTSSYSSVNGFTSSELDTVKNIYNARPGMISTLEDTYPALNNNSQRRTTSDNLYNEMELIINDDNDRIYKYFNDFYNAWSNWYRYTIGNK